MMLGRIFDYQRFEGNNALSLLIGESEKRYDKIRPFAGKVLSDEQLSFVNAAGEDVPLWKTTGNGKPKNS